MKNCNSKILNIMKQILIIFLVLVNAVVCNAQIAVNEDGSTCVGNSSCFWGFGTIDPLGGEWSTINPSNFNVGGGVTIAAYANNLNAPLNITPAIKRPGTSCISVFYVTNTGAIYSRDGIIQLSDSTTKTNITPLNSTLSKIQVLNGVSYDFKDEAEDAQMQRSAVNNTSSKRIGLLAQDVGKVYPEVIRTFDDGSQGIMYTDLIAVLIEGMKELNDSLTDISTQYAILENKVDSLQEQLKILMQSLSPQTRAPQQNAADRVGKSLKDAVLYQNVPNPFNQMTEIGYRLSADVKTAAIGVYDLNGKLLKNYALSPYVMESKIQVDASDFESGMYIYALVIDGVMIDSKRMILN